MIASCFHGDGGSGLAIWSSTEWWMDWALFSWLDTQPAAASSLTPLDGTLLPRIKSGWISITKKKPSRAPQKPSLKLATDKFCSVSENFPLMHLGFDKDRDSLVSPALSPLHSSPPLPYICYTWGGGSPYWCGLNSSRKVLESLPFLFLNNLLGLENLGRWEGRHFSHS